MDDHPAVEKLRSLMPGLRQSHHISRVRVFGPVVAGAKIGDGHIGVLLDFDETPSMFDLSTIQNTLEEELGEPVNLAVEGMIQPAWEPQIQKEAVDI